MEAINKTIAKLQLAQIGWVVRDINEGVKFFANALGIADFPEPETVRAQDLGLTYYGRVVDAEWLTTQAYNGSAFIELIQPVSSQYRIYSVPNWSKFVNLNSRPHQSGLPSSIYR